MFVDQPNFTNKARIKSNCLTHVATLPSQYPTARWSKVATFTKITLVDVSHFLENVQVKFGTLRGVFDMWKQIEYTLDRWDHR